MPLEFSVQSKQRVERLLSRYPTKQAAPDTSKPYVMYGGTPYAHIMFPVK